MMMRLFQLLTPATILLVWIAMGTNAQEPAPTCQQVEMTNQIDAVEGSCSPGR
jgi:hypothetical protein